MAGPVGDPKHDKPATPWPAMDAPSIRMRLDFIIGLLGLLVIGVGFLMVIQDVTVGLFFFLVVLLVGVVALRSYLRTWIPGDAEDG